MRKLPPQSQSLALEQKEVLATVSTAVSSAPASTQLSTGPTRTWRNRLRQPGDPGPLLWVSCPHLGPDSLGSEEEGYILGRPLPLFGESGCDH